MPATNWSAAKIATRVGGAIVILATLLVVVLLVVLFSAPWTFTPRYAGGLLNTAMLGSMVVSAFGGFGMLAVTGRPWWMLAPAIFGISLFALWIFARAMSVAGMH